MFLEKKGFPEEDELVLCTVTDVQHHSIFARLDEYGKTGLIHISEVSPGRIRNIRDFVVEDKKIVCKVLRVNTERGHIDLSLRRVTEGQRKSKVNSIKQEQKAEKIIETVAKKLNLNAKDLYIKITANILEKYPSVYLFFEDVIKDEKILKETGASEEILKELEEAVKSRIKKAAVEIRGSLKLTSYDPNGVDIIKETLKKAEETDKEKTKIGYEGGGKYKLVVNAPNYKEAERIMKNAVDAAIGHIEKKGGECSFARE